MSQKATGCGCCGPKDKTKRKQLPPVPDPTFPDKRVGLTSEEVVARHAVYGFNESVVEEQHVVVRFLLKFVGPVEFILEALFIWFVVVERFIDNAINTQAGAPGASNSTALSSPFFDHSAPGVPVVEPPSWVNGIIVLLLLIANAIMAFIQEQRAANALHDLQARLQVEAKVLRNGEWAQIAGREVVPGDVIRVRLGDVVPADMHLLEGDIDADQSALTGESKEATKKPGEAIFGGSIIKRGEGVGFVERIGERTLFGKTVELVQTSAPKMHVQRLMAKLTYVIMAVIIIFLVIAIIIQAALGRSVLDIVPIVIVLVVSGVPVALPAMVTVTLAMASSSLSKKKVLLTRLNAAEDAAQVSIVCFDKTGTITMNKLSLVGAWAAEKSSSEEAAKQSVVQIAALCSKKENNDALDTAIFESLDKPGRKFVRKFKELDFIPFDASRRRIETTIQEKVAAEGTNPTILKTMKGAVNTVLEFVTVTKKQRSKIEKTVTEFSAAGWRTLAVAMYTAPSDSSAKSVLKTKSEDLKGEYQLVGLLAFADAPRPDSKQVIEELQNGLGVRVMMLTGDAQKIASHIAETVGLGENIISLADFKKELNADHLRIEDLAAADEDGHKNKQPKKNAPRPPTFPHSLPLATASGFSEVFPEDKHLVVKLLQMRGYIVGMSGDGVNDAPALKQAEVGIAVSNATDVAKGAASAVLMSDGLSAVTDLIKVGRQAHQKLVTWIINKTAKTFQNILFLVILFFILGVFAIDATKMLILLLLVDFVTVSLAFDNARWHSKPEHFQIIRLVLIGCYLGILFVLENLGIVYVCLYYFELSADGVYTFVFDILFFEGITSVLLFRERGWFWSSRPGWILLLVITIDAAIGIIISTVGIPALGIRAISAGWVFSALGFNLATSIINDALKVFVFAMYDRWDDYIERRERAAEATATELTTVKAE